MLLDANFCLLTNRCRLAHFVHSPSVFTLIPRLTPAQESFLPCCPAVSCTEWMWVLNMCDLEHLSFFSVLPLSSFIKPRFVMSTQHQSKTRVKIRIFAVFLFKHEAQMKLMWYGYLNFSLGNQQFVRCLHWIEIEISPALQRHEKMHIFVKEL